MLKNNIAYICHSMILNKHIQYSVQLYTTNFLQSFKFLEQCFHLVYENMNEPMFMLKKHSCFASDLTS